MDGDDHPVGNGEALRMRLSRQLGYKNVKFITGSTVTDSLKRPDSSSAISKLTSYAVRP
jgi:DMSO/TMAO reductase YedYZ molybdopterin-dependent catalytic subunit